MTRNYNNKKLRAVFLAALMFLWVFAGTVAFAGGAAAQSAGTFEDQTLSSNGEIAAQGVGVPSESGDYALVVTENDGTTGGDTVVGISDALSAGATTDVAVKVDTSSNEGDTSVSDSGVSQLSAGTHSVHLVQTSNLNDDPADSDISTVVSTYPGDVEFSSGTSTVFTDGSNGAVSVEVLDQDKDRTDADTLHVSDVSFDDTSTDTTVAVSDGSNTIYFDDQSNIDDGTLDLSSPSSGGSLTLSDGDTITVEVLDDETDSLTGSDANTISIAQSDGSLDTNGVTDSANIVEGAVDSASPGSPTDVELDLSNAPQTIEDITVTGIPSDGESTVYVGADVTSLTSAGADLSSLTAISGGVVVENSDVSVDSGTVQASGGNNEVVQYTFTVAEGTTSFTIQEFPFSGIDTSAASEVSGLEHEVDASNLAGFTGGASDVSGETTDQYAVTADAGSGASAQANYVDYEGIDTEVVFQGQDVYVVGDAIDDNAGTDTTLNVRQVDSFTENNNVESSSQVEQVSPQTIDNLVADGAISSATADQFDGRNLAVEIDTEDYDADFFFLRGVEGLPQNPNEADTFEVTVQDLDMIFDEEDLPATNEDADDSTVELEFDSDRGQYSLNVSADGDLDEEELFNIFAQDDTAFDQEQYDSAYQAYTDGELYNGRDADGDLQGPPHR